MGAMVYPKEVSCIQDATYWVRIVYLMSCLLKVKFHIFSFSHPKFNVERLCRRVISLSEDFVNLVIEKISCRHLEVLPVLFIFHFKLAKGEGVGSFSISQLSQWRPSFYRGARVSLMAAHEPEINFNVFGVSRPLRKSRRDCIL